MNKEEKRKASAGVLRNTKKAVKKAKEIYPGPLGILMARMIIEMGKAHAWIIIATPRENFGSLPIVGEGGKLVGPNFKE